MSLEVIRPTYSAVKSVNGEVGAIEITADKLGAATVDYVDKTAKQILDNWELNLDGYATKQYVDYMLLEVPETTIFRNYYTKEEVEAKYKFYTDERIDALEIDKYALKTEIPEMPNLEPYALKTDIPETPDLTPYALKTDIPAVPNAVSGLENDVGYQTAAQVEAAISTALGNIGVAEEGAY